MLESQGGVHELEAAITDLHEWRRYNILHQSVRLSLMDKFQLSYARKLLPGIFRSVMRSGIGGIKQGNNINVKCLHLQAASFIALGRHPGSEWLKAKGLCSDCGGGHSCSRSCSL